jgi:hypothetical protein
LRLLGTDSPQEWEGQLSFQKVGKAGKNTPACVGGMKRFKLGIMKRAIKAILIAAALVMSTRSQLQSQEFSCEGTLKITNIGAKQTREHRYNFHVGFKDDLWEIESFDGPYVGKLTTNEWRYLHVMTDGGSAYSLAYYTTNKPNRLTEPKEKHQFSGGVKWGSLPIERYHRLLWTIFSPGKLTITNKALAFLPSWDDNFPELPEWDYNVKRLLEKPNVIEEIEYILKGSFWSKRTKQQKHFPEPYDAGFSEADYRLMRTTNVGGLTLPLAFQLKRYGFVQNAKTKDDRLLIERWEGSVEKAAASFGKVGHPLPGRIPVRDYRGANPAQGTEAATYSIAYEDWFPPELPKTIPR